MNPIPFTCASWLLTSSSVSHQYSPALGGHFSTKEIIDLIWVQIYFVLFYKMYKLTASNYCFGELNFTSLCSLLKVVTINQPLNHSQWGSRSDRLKCCETAASYFIFWYKHFFFNCQLNYAVAGLQGVSNYLLILKMISLFVDTDWLTKLQAVNIVCRSLSKVLCFCSQLCDPVLCLFGCIVPSEM